MKKLRIILLISVLFSSTLFMPSFATSSTGVTEVYIQSSDKLGVGTKTPTAEFTINGDLLIKDASEGANKVLTSDSNGLASWQTLIYNSNGSWTDTGTLLHPSDLSGAEDLAIGGTTIANADILFYANGNSIFNKQANAVNTRIEGTGEQNLFSVNGTDNQVGIGLLNTTEKLTVNGAIALNELTNSPNLSSGYGKIYVNGSVLYFKDDSGTEFDLALGSKIAAGSNGQIQFNSGGSFNGDENFIWDNTNGRLGLGNNAPDTVLDINGALTYKKYYTIPEFGQVGPSTMNNTGNNIQISPFGNSEDLLIAVLAVNGCTMSAIANGWSLLDSVSTANNNIYIVWRMHSAGTPPAFYTFTLSASCTYAYISYSMLNVSYPEPFHSFEYASGTTTKASPIQTYPEATDPTLIPYVNYRKISQLIQHNPHMTWTNNGMTNDPPDVTRIATMGTFDFSFTTGVSNGTLIAPSTSNTKCNLMMPICTDIQDDIYTIVMENNYYDPGEPDIGSSVLYSTIYGDTVISSRYAGDTIGVTLADFNGDPLEKGYNGVTLSELDANKLIKTDTNKKLASVDEITISGSNVGLSMTNPNELLSINGSISLKETSSPTATAGFGKFYVKDSDNNLHFLNAASSDYFLATGNAAGNDSEIQFNNSGDFGASSGLTWDGTSVSTTKLKTDLGTSAAPGLSFSSDTDTGIYSPGANILRIGTGNSNALEINSGNIGINTASPQAKLEVNGTLAFTGSTITNVTAGSGLSAVTSSFIKIQGSPGAVDITNNPQIQTYLQDGTILTIIGQSDTNTVLFEEGNGLSLSEGASATLGLNDTLVLIYDADDILWLEISRSFE